MNLHRLLAQRAAEGKPLRVLLIGAGKFGSMFLAQAWRTRREMESWFTAEWGSGGLTT